MIVHSVFCQSSSPHFSGPQPDLLVVLGKNYSPSSRGQLCFSPRWGVSNGPSRTRLTRARSRVSSVCGPPSSNRLQLRTKNLAECSSLIRARELKKRDSQRIYLFAFDDPHDHLFFFPRDILFLCPQFSLTHLSECSIAFVWHYYHLSGVDRDSYPFNTCKLLQFCLSGDKSTLPPFARPFLVLPHSSCKPSFRRDLMPPVQEMMPILLPVYR
ncbi:unnamed protein product [Protopolystoma xenopodis]|uniref:Uncharacterized protein n=1 Tax=Protopolystoma xenopodis TaxID=117903 RepID=A0A448X678_9PLAT|nr:unnamed protein product [Protopolystoma xenopodis]